MNERPSNQNTGIWNRKILVEKESGNPLVLHDHRDCGSVTIADGKIERADVAGSSPDDPICFRNHVDVPNGDAPPPALYYLVCHMKPSRRDFPGNPDSREGAGITPLFPAEAGAGAGSKKIIALQATTGNSLTGMGKVLEVAGNHYAWLPMNDRTAFRKVDAWLKEFMALDFETAKSIAEAEDRWSLKQEIQEAYEKLLDITHPGDPTAPLAFRLLCDAWHEVHVAGNTELSGFPITAPAILDDWLAPFSPEGTGDPAIASVVSKMGDGDTKEKVKKVLETATGDPRVHVVAFLGIKEKASEKSEGGAQ